MSPPDLPPPSLPVDPEPPAAAPLPPAPSPQPLPRPASGTLGSHGTHQRRVLARALDLLVFVALANVLEPAGPLLALCYVLFADAVWPGQSPAKRLVRVRVVRRSTGLPAGLLHSVARNAPLGVALLMWLVPVLGWVLLPVLGLPVLFLETRFCRAGERGRRMGDILAETYVADHWEAG